MPFSNTVTDVIPWGNGLVMEYGTFNLDGVTVGIITANVADTFTVGDVDITEILAWGFASDGDNAVSPARDVDPNQIQITGTSADTGDYWILGKAK